MLVFLKAFLIALASLLGISSQSPTVPTPSSIQIQSVATPTPVATPSPSPTPTPTPVTTPTPTIMPTPTILASPTPNGQTQVLDILKKRLEDAEIKYKQANAALSEKCEARDQCRIKYPEAKYREAQEWKNDQWVWIVDPCVQINQECVSASVDFSASLAEFNSVERQYLYILGQK